MWVPAMFLRAIGDDESNICSPYLNLTNVTYSSSCDPLETRIFKIPNKAKVKEVAFGHGIMH